LNAIDEGLHESLASVWERLASDGEARAVILTGSGRAFSVGGDTAMMERHHGDDWHNDRITRESGRILMEIVQFPLPVVAAVNGPAIGLGCNLCVTCDIVLMAESAYMADPHVSVGLVAGDGATAVWPALMSLLKAKEYLLTGDRIPAAVAVETGLANRVIADDRLMVEALELAQKLADQPPRALQETKAALNLHLMSVMMGPMQFAMRAERASLDSEEHRLRVRAFQQRKTSDR
jgi:enoyl-CoA hydratase